MQNWIQHQFRFTSEFQRKIKGTWNEKQRKGNKGIRKSNKSKAHKRNSDVLIYFRICLHLVEFSSTAFGPGGKKTTACRKQPFNHLGQQMVWQLQETWALKVEFSSWICNNMHIAWRHTTIFAWFTPSLMHSHMVSSYRFFLAGPYRFTWFGDLPLLK